MKANLTGVPSDARRRRISITVVSRGRSGHDDERVFEAGHGLTGKGLSVSKHTDV